jgi:hypothetical protein
LYNISTNTYTTLDDPLATNGTTAYGIDGSNIVGEYIGGNNSYEGFLYNGSTYTTFDDSLAVDTTLTDISGNNVVGYISGGGIGTEGFTVSVPEPALASLVGMTAWVLLVRRRALPIDS